jgi:hypothetical protein
MDVNRMASAAVITAGVGISALMFGTGPVTAAPLAPLDPPPSPTSPAPDQPPAPGSKIALPQSGGSQHGGHALPVQPPPGSP